MSLIIKNVVQSLKCGVIESSNDSKYTDFDFVMITNKKLVIEKLTGALDGFTFFKS